MGIRRAKLLHAFMAGSVMFGAAWMLRGRTLAAAGDARSTAAPAPPTVREIYLRDCATCHGADGRGTNLGPDLHGAGGALVDYYLTTGRMPLSSPHARVHTQAPKYPPETIRALDDYVAALAGGGLPIPQVNTASGDLAEGGTLYRLNCAACHAWSGDGGALLYREAPPIHSATDTQIAEAVRGGPGNMPAFGDAALTQKQLASVVRYVRYLDHPTNRGGSPLWYIGPLVEGAVAIFLGLGALVMAIRMIGTRT